MNQPMFYPADKSGEPIQTETKRRKKIGVNLIKKKDVFFQQYESLGNSFLGVISKRHDD
jgi:hypothetical protein